MLQHSLFKVVEEEQQALAARIAEEEASERPDPERLDQLRRRWVDVRRELESFPEYTFARDGSAH